MMTTATVRGLGGRDRVLVYSVNAVAELEERSSRNIGQFLAAIHLNQLAVSFAACRWLVWAGLLHDDEQFMRVGVPSVTLMQVGEWLQGWLAAGHGIGELGTAIAIGLEASGLVGTRKAAPGNDQPEATAA